MPDSFFISYNSADRDWAHWIAWTLQDLGHRVRVHEWEIASGGNVPMWMEQALTDADAMIAVVSPAFLDARYSQAEVHAGNWRGFQSRGGFVKPVVVADVADWPIFLGNLKRLSLVGLSREQSRDALAAFVSDPVAPRSEPGFPGADSPPAAAKSTPARAPAGPPPSAVQIDRLLAAHRHGDERERVSQAVADWLQRDDLPADADVSLGRLFNEDAIYRLDRLGDIDGAIRRFDAALTCHLRAFGAASNDVAVLKSNKASALVEIGTPACLTEALGLAREAVAAQEAQFGPNPAEADVSRLMTARILLARHGPGDLDEADRLLAEARRVARTAQTQRDLDGMRARVAKARRTRAGLAAALDIERALLDAVSDDRSEERATSLNNLAFTLWAMGRHREAERHLQAALDLRRSFLHPNHPAISDNEASLAALQRGEPSGFEARD